MDGALKQQVQDAFFSSGLKPGTRGGDAGKDGAAATGRGGDAVDAPGAAEARPRTHASVSTAGSKHRRRHHRDGSVTVRSTKEAGAQVLKLAEEEEGLDHARSANLEKARLRYLSEVARAQDMAHKQDAEIQVGLLHPVWCALCDLVPCKAEGALRSSSSVIAVRPRLTRCCRWWSRSGGARPSTRWPSRSRCATSWHGNALTSSRCKIQSVSAPGPGAACSTAA